MPIDVAQEQLIRLKAFFAARGKFPTLALSFAFIEDYGVRVSHSRFSRTSKNPAEVESFVELLEAFKEAPCPQGSI